MERIFLGFVCGPGLDGLGGEACCSSPAVASGRAAASSETAILPASCIAQKPVLGVCFGLQAISSDSLTE